MRKASKIKSKSTIVRFLLLLVILLAFPSEDGVGIENWQQLADRLRKLPHVAAVSSVLYDTTFFTGPLQAKGGILKGVPDSTRGSFYSSTTSTNTPLIMSGSAVVSDQVYFTNSSGAVINWQGFSIAADEITRFIQSGAGSFSPASLTRSVR